MVAVFEDEAHRFSFYVESQTDQVQILEFGQKIEIEIFQRKAIIERQVVQILEIIGHQVQLLLLKVDTFNVE